MEKRLSQDQAWSPAMDTEAVKRVLRDHPKVTVFSDMEACHGYAETLGLEYLFPIDDIDGAIPIAVRDPRRTYDVAELRWLSSLPGTVLFHLLHADGRVSQIDYAQSCLRPLLRVGSVAAYAEFVTYLHKSYAVVRNRLETVKPFMAPFQKIAKIHIPFPRFDDNGEICHALRFESLSQIAPLVELHRELDVPWLSWLRKGDSSPLVFGSTLAEPDAVAKAQQETLRRCREIIPLPSFPVRPEKQFVLIDPWEIRATSVWPHPPSPRSTHDVLLEILRSHSASFLAFFLQSTGGRPTLDSLGRIVQYGDMSVTESKLPITVPPLQIEFWVRIAHQSEFLADAYERLADRARSPFSAVMPENACVAIPPLSGNPLIPPPSCADLSKRMVREILGLPFSDLQ